MQSCSQSHNLYNQSRCIVNSNYSNYSIIIIFIIIIIIIKDNLLEKSAKVNEKMLNHYKYNYIS